MCKIMSGLVDITPTEGILTTNTRLTRRQLSKLLLPHPRTNTHLHSFYPSAIQPWNKIPGRVSRPAPTQPSKQHSRSESKTIRVPISTHFKNSEKLYKNTVFNQCFKLCMCGLWNVPLNKYSGNHMNVKKNNR